MSAEVRNISTMTSSIGATIEIPMPVMAEGDHLYAFVGCYGQFLATLGPCADFETPDGWQIDEDAMVPITESATVVGRFAVFHRIAPAAQLTNIMIPNPVNATERLGFSVAGAIKNVGGAPGFDSIVQGPFQVDDVPTPAVPVHSSDSVVVFAMACIGGTHPVPSVDPPYLGPLRQFTKLLYGGEVSVWLTNPVSADVPSVPTNIHIEPQIVGVQVWYAIAAIELLPAVTTLPLPSTATERRLRLGCADDYNVFVTGADYRTPIDGVGWSDIEWSRVLDESSTASVTIPDRLGGVRCCAHLGGLLPWRYGLLIERNDVPVWSGPVTQIQRQQGGLRISASDVLARFQKRLAVREEQLIFEQADAGVAFATVVLSAQIAGESWGLQPPEILTLAPYTRTISVAEFEYAWDIIQDLAESAIDFWIGDGVLYAFEPGSGWKYWNGTANVLLEGPYLPNRELLYGTFTENVFTEMPTWSINGWSQANSAWVPGPDVGEDGARRFWAASNPVSIDADGVLDHVETANQFSPEEEEDIPEAVMQMFADSLIAQRSVLPAVMEGGGLAENAPIDVDHLRPGSLWAIDVFDACYGQLLQIGRLKRVTVRVSKSGDGAVLETVSPTVFPLGFEEGG